MEIHRVCKTCDGTGEIERGDGETRTCYSCKGVGWHDRGEVANETKTLDQRLTELESKVGDIKDKCDDILEKLE